MKQARPADSEAIEHAAQDQSLHDLAVDDLEVVADQEIHVSGVISPCPALGHDSFHRGGTHVLDARKAVDYPAVADRELRLREVDVRRQDLDTHRAGLADVLRELVRGVDFVGQVGGHELRGIVGFEIGGVVGQQGIGGSMGLVEAVAGKGHQEIEDPFGGPCIVSLGGGPLEELDLLSGHYLRLLLAHRPPEDVRLTEGKPRHLPGDLHDLLLVHDHPVGLLEDRLELRQRIHDRLAPALGIAELVDELHGSRAVQGVQGDQVRNGFRPGPLEHVLHPLTLELEHAGAAPLAEEAEGLGIVLRDPTGLEMDAAPLEQPEGVLDDRQGLEAEEVHLHQPQILEVVHGVLGGNHSCLRVPVQGHVAGQVVLPDHDPRRVGRSVAVQALELEARLQQAAIDLPPISHRGQLRILLERSCQGYLGTHRDLLGDGVRFGVRQVEHPGHVADHGPGLEGPEGDDLTDPAVAVLADHVVDHRPPALVAEIDVEVGHGDPLGVQEALEQEAVLQGIDVRDLEGIGHQRPRAGAPARSHRDAVFPGEANKIPHHQEVAGVAH